MNKQVYSQPEITLGTYETVNMLVVSGGEGSDNIFDFGDLISGGGL